MAKVSWKEKYRGKCSSMLIDPFFEGNYFDEYSILDGLKPEVGELRQNEYIRYCALLLDPYSPYVREYPDLKKRREVISLDIKYMGHTSTDFEVKMLLKVYRNNDWTLYCSEQNTFYEFVERVNKPIELDEGADPEKQMKAVLLKDKYLESLNKISEHLDSRFKKIFSFDEELMDTAKKVAITPEMVAKGHTF